MNNRVILVEVPSGKLLQLPLEAMDCLGGAHIVDWVNYDWNQLQRSREALSLRVVQEDEIEPAARPDPPQLLKAMADAAAAESALAPALMPVPADEDLPV